MTQREIASAIQNNVSNGLKGVANFSYSMDQIMDEIAVEWNVAIDQLSKQPGFNYYDYLQTITCIPVDCEDLAKCCIETGLDKIKHFEIPKVRNIFSLDTIVIGPASKTMTYKVYLDVMMVRHGTTSFLTGNMPFIYLDPTVNRNGKFDGFIINAPKHLDYLFVQAVFDNPWDVQEYDCCSGEFSIDKTIAKIIIQQITERYLRYYTRLHQQPNTGTGLGQ